MVDGIGGGVFGAFAFDRVISGSLLQLGTSFTPYGDKKFDIGGFTNELVSWGKGVDKLSKSIYYFVPGGGNAGAGRLSMGLAQDAAAWIREGMKDPKLRKQRYKGPAMPPRHPHYQEWVDKTEFSRTPTMSLTGWSADFFGVIAVKGEGVSLGINPDAETQSPIPGSDPLEYSEHYSNILSYMRTHELGLNHMPQRPLMTGLVLGYLQQTDTVWADLFREYLEKSYWKTYQKARKEVPTKSLGSFKPKRSASPAATRAEVVHQYDGMAAIVDNSAAILEENYGTFLQGASDRLGGGQMDSETLDIFIKSTRAQLRTWGRTEAAIETVIQACMKGKRIKDY